MVNTDRARAGVLEQTARDLIEAFDFVRLNPVDSGALREQVDRLRSLVETPDEAIGRLAGTHNFDEVKAILQHEVIDIREEIPSTDFERLHIAEDDLMRHALLAIWKMGPLDDHGNGIHPAAVAAQLGLSTQDLNFSRSCS